MLQVYRVPLNLAQSSQRPVVLPLVQKLHQIILNTVEPDTVGASVAQALAETFEADACLLIAQAERQSTPLMIGWAVQRDSDPLYRDISAPDYEALWHLLQPAKILALNRLEAIADSESGLEQALAQFCNHVLADWQVQPAQALLTLILSYPGLDQGMIVLLKHTPHAWTVSETNKLKTLSDLTAIALIQAIQLRHMQTLQRDVFLANQYQALSQNVLGSLHRTLVQEDLLKLALQTTAQTLQAERGLFLMLKYETHVFKRSESDAVPKAKVSLNQEWLDATLAEPPPKGATEPEVELQRLVSEWFWLSECQLCQQVLANANQTLTISNIQDANEWKDTSIAPIFDRDRFATFLVTPLLSPANSHSQGATLGFWVLQSRQPRIWSTLEQQFAESIAALVSSVIIHNQALRQVQTLVDERTAQLEQNQRIQTKLHEITRKQVEQLRQLNQLKDEFLDTLSHELRTPLTSMKMAITMLRQPGMLTDRAEKYLDVLEHEWSRENNLIKDLLLLQELESSPVISPNHSTSLSHLIEESVAEVQEQWKNKQVFLNLEYPPKMPLIYTDPQSLKRVFKELLTNAGKFARSQTTIQLNLATEVTPNGEMVVMNLTNYGIGITPAEQGVIFDKFRRGQGVTQKAIPGVGLGLALVKCFVNQLHGQILVTSHPVIESEQFWETRFTVRLPIQPPESTPLT